MKHVDFDLETKMVAQGYVFSTSLQECYPCWDTISAVSSECSYYLEVCSVCRYLGMHLCV